jgi:hypothetical protein
MKIEESLSRSEMRMTILQDRKSTCWPSPEQELLLRAALMQDSVALDAWNEWRVRVGLASIDPGSQRLLPLLWDNLRRQGVDPDDPGIRPLRRSYRVTLSINKLLFHEISRQLRALHGAGFPTMLLKGAALTVRYYKDYGLRPMGDFDILIPTAQTEDVLRFLMTNGWDPAPRSPEAFTRPYRQVTHAHEFHGHSAWEFDLHWHVLDECCQPDADEDFWNGAVRLDLDGIPTTLLNPADQLLHVCVHGVRWNDTPPLRWVADAITVLRASEHGLDWDRLIVQTEKRRLILPMRASLNYLRTLLEAPIPSGVLERLDNLPTSRLEHFEYQYKTRSHRDRAFGYLPLLWCKHSRLAGDIGLPAKLWGFVPFLQKFWGAEHRRQFLRFLLLMSRQRVQKVAENIRLDKPVKRLNKEQARRPNHSHFFCLIFSKNRAMQLDALLRSFFMHCKDLDCIDMAVLYLATSSNYEQQYDKLMKANDKVNFIQQTNFRKQVLDGMAPYDFILFLVDDCLFVNDFSVMDCIGSLDANDEALGFSLRLGRNTVYCYVHNAVQSVPEYTEVSKDVINFDWTKAEGDFNYPLELSSSFYRTGDILPLMKRARFRNPNTLEATLNAKKAFFKIQKRYLTCFRQSAAFSVPANRVQRVHANRAGDRYGYPPERLNDLFSKGYRINVEKLSGYIPKGCHEEVELNFTLMEGPDTILREEAVKK